MAAKWSEEAFRRKVKSAADGMGVTEREILRRAALSEDTFSKPPKEGRRIDTVLRIAEAAGLSPEDALGVSEMSPETRRQLKRLALVADIAAHLYVALSERSSRAEPGAPEPKQLISAIMDLIDGTPAEQPTRQRTKAPPAVKKNESV